MPLTPAPRVRYAFLAERLPVHSFQRAIVSANEFQLMSGWLRKSWVVELCAVSLAGLAPAAIIRLGDSARASLCERQRKTLAFVDVACAAPGNLSRAEFLDEVQYLAGIPERLNLLDAELPKQLETAFARHPWVEHVERIDFSTAHGLRVRLAYRTPVLAVVAPSAANREKPAEADTAGDSGERASSRVKVLDRDGFVLPAQAYRPDLPRFHSAIATATPGQRWQGEDALAAARLAEYLRPYQQRLQVHEIAVASGSLLIKRRGRAPLLWGRLPGAERAGEELAAAKLKRLLDVPQTPVSATTVPQRVVPWRGGGAPVLFADHVTASRANRDQVSNSSR
jgi:hypothetical protein